MKPAHHNTEKGPKEAHPSDFGPFRLASFHNILRSRRILPERSAAYAIYVRGGTELLAAMGFSESCRPALNSPDPEFAHVYSGSSFDLRDRVKFHAVGDTRCSTFRKTMLAGELICGAIGATGEALPKAANVEHSLDLWLASNALLLYWRSSRHEQLERELLDTIASPLNVTHRKSEPFAKRIMAMRSLYDERPPLKCCRGAADSLMLGRARLRASAANASQSI